MIECLSHITLLVKNLDKMEEILLAIFDARKIFDSGNQTYSLSKERFYLINEIWFAVMEGEPLSEKTYNHIAFKINESDVDKYFLRIKQLGLEIKPPRDRIEGEAYSIYFYDHDNHLFELHTGTLKERLKAYNSMNLAS
jgi:catechol 2,3-dioxygenase-like lactoylglutathione lyase family enzyme